MQRFAMHLRVVQIVVLMLMMTISVNNDNVFCDERIDVRYVYRLAVVGDRTADV